MIDEFYIWNRDRARTLLHQLHYRFPRFKWKSASLLWLMNLIYVESNVSFHLKFDSVGVTDESYIWNSDGARTLLHQLHYSFTRFKWKDASLLWLMNLTFEIAMEQKLCLINYTITSPDSDEKAFRYCDWWILHLK